MLCLWPFVCLALSPCSCCSHMTAAWWILCPVWCLSFLPIVSVISNMGPFSSVRFGSASGSLMPLCSIVSAPLPHCHSSLTSYYVFILQACSWDFITFTKLINTMIMWGLINSNLGFSLMRLCVHADNFDILITKSWSSQIDPPRRPETGALRAQDGKNCL